MRNRRHPGRLTVAVIAAAVVAAVALGVAVFSGGPIANRSGAAATGDTPARGNLAASAASSAGASSVAFTVSVSETSSSSGTTSPSGTTLLRGNGAVDVAKGVGRLTATVPGLSSLAGSGSQGSVDVITDGSNVYLQVPGLSSLTGGKPWVEASVSQLGSLTGSQAGSLSLSTLADPSPLLSALGHLGSVTKVGSVSLDGQPATEYQATISVSSLLAQLPQGSAQASRAAQALQQLGLPDIPVTVWVGQNGLLQQVSLSIDLSHASLSDLLGGLGLGSAGSSGSGGTILITVGLSHYGDPVAVNVPPASAVTDLGAIGSSVKGILSQLGGTLSGIASHV